MDGITKSQSHTKIFGVQRVIEVSCRAKQDKGPAFVLHLAAKQAEIFIILKLNESIESELVLYRCI